MSRLKSAKNQKLKNVVLFIPDNFSLEDIYSTFENFIPLLPFFIISEIIYSVTYTDEDIAEQTDFSMDDLIQRLGFVEEDMGYDLDNYIDDVHELIIQINMIEAMLAERAR